MYNYNDELAMYQQQIVRKQRLKEINSNLEEQNKKEKRVISG